MGLPMFLASLHLPFSNFMYQISRPPKPPFRSLEKQIVLPSAEMEGCDSQAVELMGVKPLGDVHLSFFF